MRIPACAALLVFGGWLVLSPGCAKPGECASGETRACGCPYACTYTGCGVCSALMYAYDENQTCTDDGVWNPCACYPVIATECAGVGTAARERGCSMFLHGLLFGLPVGGDEAACRAAGAAFWKCVAAPSSKCDAEVAPLDAACLDPKTRPVCPAH